MARTTMKHHHQYHHVSDTWTRITVMGLTVLLLWGEVSRVEGGCSRFGHSCFGAHGKRADIPAGYNNLDPMMMIAPVASNQQLAAAPGIPAETVPEGYFSPNLLPLSGNSNSRISPYLLEWILSAHRGDSRQAPSSSADDATYRKK